MEMAMPPTTAKSTPLRTRATNSFSNGEKFSGWEFIFGELEDESVELLQSNQTIAAGRETPDHFADRLLHRLNLRFHQGKLNPVKGGWSIPRRGEFHFRACLKSSSRREEALNE